MDNWKIRKDHSGFTLMEMLIVVAMIAVLVAISIPIFVNILEKSRESTDLANVRSAYAEVLAAACLDDSENAEKTVALKQKVDGWQSADTVNIGGIVHSTGQEDTPNWKGDPVGGGVCQVSYSADVGVILNWNGGTGPQPNRYGDLLGPLKNSGMLDRDTSDGFGLQGAQNYEIDSLAGTKRVQGIADNLDGTLLAQPGCSWGYYGNAPQGKHNLFWSSVDISKLSPSTSVPVIIAASSGKFYVTETSIIKKGKYNALASSVTYKNYMTGTTYGTLEEAYAAYEKAVAQGPYKDTLQ